MIKLLPQNVKTLHMFPNKQNTHVIDLAKKLGFHNHGGHTILMFSNKYIGMPTNELAIELSQEYFQDFVNLHDTVFPNAYYKGKQIIRRLNKHRKVFIIKENSSLCGYIYAEAEPDVSLSNIEFLAVDESQRRKGIASRLLSIALKWLFSFDTINSITLCVNLKNDKAIKLYTNF
ncbi:GNAT family N-acetyltransferase [Clostridium oryzae]|uniref:Putative acetyltransferase n=1 Tax=Clostridium oryzae TaxID=1450648 RepID=A0A1V4IXA0_9CLOT|nr:GNAT family N-acetyltransferase [Clostridium oryzae]OPJ64037.1 putative acetyltransferase [Clostridium oryzae]